MIAFEDFALFLVQMETFRYFGGHLVVAYLECAIKKVYELMKIYEKDGLLKMRHAYKASDNPNIPYDSDAQTEFSNQLTNSHLCLYEFRESAEFIAFTDWDDVLFVRQIFGKIPLTFAESFRKISFLNPSVASFSVSRYPFINEKAFRPKSYPFSFEKLFNQLNYSLKTTPSKLVVRPQNVGGVWIHNLGYLESNKYQDINVDSKIAAIFHIKNLITDEGETETPIKKLIYTENGSHLIVGKVLQKNMVKMFGKYNFTLAPSEYSHSQIFHKLIFKCYDAITKKKVDKTLLFCPTHKGCIYPEQNITVIKVAATYKKPKKIAGSIWHEREKVDFVESNKGCL
uniref:Glycosyltransferase family 92 protein n=1 Tax=Panagrolaimus davidi TaxID=227884 RepID=A0A914PIN2_9BILA